MLAYVITPIIIGMFSAAFCVAVLAKDVTLGKVASAGILGWAVPMCVVSYFANSINSPVGPLAAGLFISSLLAFMIVFYVAKGVIERRKICKELHNKVIKIMSRNNPKFKETKELEKTIYALIKEERYIDMRSEIWMDRWCAKVAEELETF